ncbi:hypothetical protein FFLO_03101 [Filobasidium floriforme]|uniref:Bacterial surface antigen (D15) domain-containing protein n=1 Tax=Filobasidium floriforme TaxID=5210 RepID=A0A8K0JLP8_9TREE|nr:mitochondrion protein [Filobasidium floriforme]KAG7548988.1 hypothetical protein FFLO_03101 [Filobasidium floriforme]KAH8089792.1 mitochondrion protein [Filobasidium floriforme]
MDPHAQENRSATVEEVDVDIGFQPRTEEPRLAAPLASNIFRDAREPVFRRETQGEEVRQWQEEEFQRKLRGEYEEMQRRLHEVVETSMDHPLHISSIRIPNPPRVTRPGFLNSLISPFISKPSTSPLSIPWLNPATTSGAPNPPQTLHEILLTTKAMAAHLRGFDIFHDDVDVKFQPAEGGAVGDVDLVLGVREKGRLFLKGGTEIGGGEGGANATARLRNVFGGAETVEFNATYGTKTKSAYQLALSTPLLASPLLNLSLSAFSLDRDNTAFAAHRERSEGGRAKISARAPWGTHDLIYEFINREIGNLTPKASISIRELAYPSTKASLVHTYTRDTRDDAWTGSRGSLVKVSHEFAGLPCSSPSANFFKSTAQTQLSRMIWPGSGWHYSIASLLTISVPLSPSGKTALPDRVFLGGPNSVRGWRIGGMGLRDGHDSLGGDLAFATGLSVYAPFPAKPEWPVKLHGFINTGRVTAWDCQRTFGNNVNKLFSSPNLSAGFGLLYRLDPIRIEVNLALPLVGRKGEGWARGLGVGIGLEFL